jgi:hypothetical protein
MHIHISLGHTLHPNVAVARGTRHRSTNMRCVIEAHVRLSRIAKHSLPIQIDPFISQRRDVLDEWPIDRDRTMAYEASTHARDTGFWSLRDALVTQIRAGQPLLDVSPMGKLNGLDDLSPYAKKIPDGICNGRMGRRKDGRPCL